MGKNRNPAELSFPQMIRAYDSKIGLDNIWLRKLETAANLRQRTADDLEEWVNAQAEALFTRWVIERRQPARRNGHNGQERGRLKGRGNGGEFQP